MDKANALISMLSTQVSIMLNIWTFYFIVILGALGFIGTMRSGSHALDRTTKLTVTIFVLIFALGNFLAMREAGTNIINFQSELIGALGPVGLPKVFDHIYSRWGEWLSLMGYVLVLILTWAPRRPQP